MKAQKLLVVANSSLLFSFTLFFVSLLFAYGLENQLPLILVTLLHVFQLLLAVVFKLAYVLRMNAQQQLGQIPG